MANLPTQNFTALVANAAAAVQASCSSLIDLAVGSVLRAILEAGAGAAIWLQYLILQVLALTRLATSTGPDVDSWVADFGLTRLPATYATGLVTMSSLAPEIQSATVLLGALVRTADASVTFAVVLDTTNPAYSATASGYIRQGGVTSISVPVECQTAGTVGNVAAGAINTLGTNTSGIDTVYNPAAFTNASDGETDAALRARFVTFINSRSEATLLAVENAVSSVQTGLLYQVAQNVDTTGAYEPGNIVVVVDDGSGDPPASLLSAVYAAVDLVRPIATSLDVIGPTVLLANVSMTLAVTSGTTLATVEAAVQTAITAYIDSLNVGASMSYSRLIQIAYATSPAVTNVSGITLNGGVVDLVVPLGTAIRAGTIAIGP